MTTTPAAKKTPARRPAAAKKPADRKPKAPAKKRASSTAATTAMKVEAGVVDAIEFEWNGEAYSIAPEAFDDVEVIEAFATMGEELGAVSAAIRILGPEQWARFKESARDPETGRVALSTEAGPFLDALFDRVRAGN